ncbi:Transmembrane protein 107-like Protein [Tribolium castaneum]|uniref:Transmembrane protein 107 n=1 Tax=Tribolium castaneum TaxID=7070 RepID=A0A139WBW8_TRICA|nr:Transmembrane protein 107-like Protein [Tribolium castaneum]
MYYASELIPAKFLVLVAHFTICVLLLWNSPQSVKACLTQEASEEVFRIHHTQLVVGLSVSVGMICFELFIFLIGLTMFHPTSALLSIGCHASACFLLSYIVLDGWQCGWFWWIFTFGSVVPILNDSCILVDIIINKKY